MKEGRARAQARRSAARCAARPDELQVVSDASHDGQRVVFRRAAQRRLAADLPVDVARRCAVREDDRACRRGGQRRADHEHELRVGVALGVVRELAGELGWSRKRIVARFREEIGLSPKAAARVLRFEQARRSAERSQRPDWAEIAVECGYYDQSHLINEFRAVTDRTPAGSIDIIAEAISFIQQVIGTSI